MKITKRQLRKLIRESLHQNQKEYGAPDFWKMRGSVDRGELKYTHREIMDYLSTNAAEYHRDPNLSASAIEELLMDDFMDNLGAYVSLSPKYHAAIKKLAASPGGQLSERISHESLQLAESDLRYAVLRFIDRYTMGMAMDPADGKYWDRVTEKINSIVQTVIN